MRAHSSRCSWKERVDQELLVGEAPVDGADADARVMSHVVEGDAEPTLGEQLARSLEDPLAVPFGVPAKSCLGAHSTQSSKKRIDRIHSDKTSPLVLLSPSNRIDIIHLGDRAWRPHRRTS